MKTILKEEDLRYPATAFKPLDHTNSQYKA